MDPQEVELTLDECVTILSNHSESEFKAMERVEQLLHGLHQMQKTREEGIKDSIYALSNSCTKEEAVIQSDADRAKEAELAGLTSQLHELSQHKGTINKELAGLKVLQDRSAEEKENLERQKEELEDATTRVLPAIRHDVNLYTYITGVRWQYDSEPHQVKGYVSSQNKVKTFSLDTQHNSQFFIANYLWEQIGADE